MARRGASGASRCCLCCDNGNCVCCSCVQVGRSCFNCLPSRGDRCSNLVLDERACTSTGRDHNSTQSDGDGDLHFDQRTAGESAVSDFVRLCFQDAFGAQLLHSEGGSYDNVWCKLWLRIVSFKNCHYYLPNGAVAHDFINLLSSEISLLARGVERLERLLVFLSVMLRCDPMVRRGTDIRCLKEWKEEKFESLVYDAERCARQFTRPRKKDDKDHTVAVFTRLMLQGQVCSAVRFITDRVSGSGVLSLDSPSNVPGMSVFDMLKQKHPEPGNVEPSTFMLCDTLPPLSDLHITAGHVERVARQLQGAAGPGGSSALQWRDYLLRFGRHSGHLRDFVAMLARHLANSIVDWDSIRALVANRLIALDKCPGVRPIGIGEALRRILGKTVALVTRADLEEVCGIDQLCLGLRLGLEGSIHAVYELFDEHCNLGWGLLLVDATNAFNSVNRVVALWNARVLWPPVF